MSSAALTSQGCSFGYLDGTVSPPEWKKVGEITGINGPNGTANVIDISDLNSTMKEKRVGLADWGNISLNIFYVPSDATLIAMKSNYVGGTRQQYCVKFSDSPATDMVFYGYLSQFSSTIGVDASVTGSIQVEIDGDITEQTGQVVYAVAP